MKIGTAIKNNNGKRTTEEFTCDGRQHCSQMRSKKEAYFFLQNCPNTKMDGDNDGEPCEKYRYPEGVRRD
ncbi:excalibur calcium-binding domain-containing protein [Candidatus Symbiopectobacterium endolongispinus]|uniref:excalibur calcium-binding domain-containing protein n=1 Tax=Candidatus Symbiopectobacterium endolongispinus TaxID=2812664 RepID=UPI003F686759